MKSLGKNSIYNVIYTCANIVFPMLTSMYVARVLMDDGVGRVAYVQNIASYFTTFATLGLPTYGVRKIAQYRDNHAELDKTFSELFFINAISTTISLVAYFVTVALIDNSMLTVQLVAAGSLAIIFNYLNIDWLYQGEEEYVYITIRSIIVKIVSFVLVVCYVRDANDYVIYTVIVGLATGGNYVFNAIHSRSFVSLTVKNIHFREHIKPLMFFAINTFLVSVYSKIDITMLGTLTTAAEVGLYSYAYRITYLLTTLCTAMTAILFPRLIYSYRNARSNFFRLLSLGQKSIMFLCIPMTAFSFLMAPDIISVLFGNAFIPASSTLRIFIPLIIIKSMGDLLGFQLMVATESEKKITVAYVISAISNIMMNALLIPVFHGNGAAMASIVSELFANGYQIVAMKKKISYKLEWNALIQSVGTSFVVCVSVMLLTSGISNHFVRLVTSALAGVVVYLTSNYLLHNSFLMLLIKKITSRN